MTRTRTRTDVMGAVGVDLVIPNMIQHILMVPPLIYTIILRFPPCLSEMIPDVNDDANAPNYITHATPHAGKRCRVMSWLCVHVRVSVG